VFKQIIFFISVLIFLACFAGGSTAAQDPAGMDEWQFSAELNGYLPDIKGETASGTGIDIELNDILDTLNFTVMGIVEAQKDKWTFAIDLIYLDIEADKSASMPRPSGNQGHPVHVSGDVELEAWTVTPRVSYNILQKDKFQLDILAGPRYLNLDVDVQADVGPLRISTSDSGSFWDGIVGARGEVMLNERWYLPYYFDIGTGQSDLTYQLYGAIAYRFANFDLTGGYRYLRWNFDDGEALDNLYLSGPMIGLKFRW